MKITLALLGIIFILIVFDLILSTLLIAAKSELKDANEKLTPPPPFEWDYCREKGWREDGE